ncbi:MAG: hypothetical protein HC825_12625 [Oscillatoriales cyanobacterium RM1_1_9]|nr:hypothetical protein [Oscillatoriales cyanobacterium RM2_1_1]NJO72285.1 hypothetical protein [Oscillatoriales cyanobacterium RM1_1_9]
MLVIKVKAEDREPGKQERNYAPTGAATAILTEHFDGSGGAWPELGLSSAAHSFGGDRPAFERWVFERWVKDLIGGTLIKNV